MSESWPAMLSQILSFLPFGFAYCEIVYKKRQGPDQKDSRRKSKYSDGKVGWRKIALRAQETLWDWEFDRFLIGKGVDGADNRLLDVIAEPQLRRVGEVQIWSGDHCFADVSRSLVRRDVRVHVFSRPTSLAASLRVAATRVTFLSELLVPDSSELAFTS